jgi:UDPglucose 6-dehydrogenase
MNIIASLCEAAGADVDAVRVGVGSDSRIGSSFLFPGVGYGGSCLPKDVRALIRSCEEFGVAHELLDGIEAVNVRQKRFVLDRVHGRFGEDLSGLTFAVWGLAFKPNTDDMREAPSLVTIEGLLRAGARVVAHDPAAMSEAKRVLSGEVVLRESNYDALKGADALLIHTEWQPYRQPDFERIREALNHPVIIDGRNLYRPSRLRELGFEYYSVGRPGR